MAPVLWTCLTQKTSQCVSRIFVSVKNIEIDMWAYSFPFWLIWVSWRSWDESTDTWWSGWNGRSSSERDGSVTDGQDTLDRQEDAVTQNCILCPCRDGLFTTTTTFSCLSSSFFYLHFQTSTLTAKNKALLFPFSQHEAGVSGRQMFEVWIQNNIWEWNQPWVCLCWTYSHVTSDFSLCFCLCFGEKKKTSHNSVVCSAYSTFPWE